MVLIPGVQTVDDCHAPGFYVAKDGEAHSIQPRVVSVVDEDVGAESLCAVLPMNNGMGGNGRESNGRRLLKSVY